jgi:DNA-directed RNA polymerase subunit M/transcription elongation factor TFIIS
MANNNINELTLNLVDTLNLELLNLEALDFDTIASMLFQELSNLPPVYNNIDIDNEMEQIMNSSLYDNSVYKQVIDDDELDKIIQTTKKYSTTKKKSLNDVCPIIQTEFEDEQNIIKLYCNHYFDADAIIHWLKEEKSECPVCRYKFKSKEIKIENNQIINNELQRTRENLINSLSRISTNNYNT